MARKKTRSASASKTVSGRVVALIPLRGGSKSIPRKNVRNIAGRPLCAWTLQAALDTPGIAEVWVSTEDAEIGRIAAAVDSRVRVLDRPDRLATDASSTESVMIHFADHVEFDWLVTLQATSPLTTSADIRAGLALVSKRGLDSLATGVRLKRFLWSDEARPLNYDPRRRPRRQEFAGTCMENGAFYVTSRRVLLRDECRLGGKTGFLEMASETAVEIDEPADWPVVERLLLARAPISDRLRSIRGLVLDVDGVLTDGAMYYGTEREALKRFHTRDGHGLSKLLEAGFRVALLTRESTPFAQARASKLGIKDVIIGSRDKASSLRSLAQRWGTPLAELAYMGDDDVDLPAMRLAGLPASPGDGEATVRAEAAFVTRALGGNGAVRELCDALLLARRANA